MAIDITAATVEAQPIIEQLLQLYEYDASEFYGADLEADGRYHVMDPDDLWRPGYHVYLLSVDVHLAGFAFVARHASYLDGTETWLIDEFFVMRKYRRRGVGEHVACTLFDRFPGRWELGQLPENIPSQTFWRQVVGRYTKGQFREENVDTERWRGPIQSFISRESTIVVDPHLNA